MTMFKYELNIGSYDEDVHIDIDLKVREGLTAEDYVIVRNALNTIEETVRKYQAINTMIDND